MTFDMEDLIGKALVEAVGDIAPLYLYEAEEDDYPYAVYYYTPEYASTKDGVYKITADVTLQVYSDEFDEAVRKSEAIQESVLRTMNSGKFNTKILTIARDCVERVWKIETVFRVKQYS